MATFGKTIYLPPIYDPKKIREGIIEILNCVKLLDEKEAAQKTG